MIQISHIYTLTRSVIRSALLFFSSVKFLFWVFLCGQYGHEWTFCGGLFYFKLYYKSIIAHAMSVYQIKIIHFNAIAYNSLIHSREREKRHIIRYMYVSMGIENTPTPSQYEIPKIESSSGKCLADWNVFRRFDFES